MWRWVLAAIALTLALACFGLGYRVGVVAVRESDRRAASFRELPVITRATQLDGGLVGRRVLVEGQIAPGNPGVEYPAGGDATRRYVIYTVSRTESTPGRNGGVNTRRVTEHTVTPPIVLSLPDGTVRVSNGDYRSASFRHVGTLAGARQVSGYTAGDRIIVDGTVALEAGGPTLRATMVDDRAPAAYITSGADQRGRGFYLLFGQAAACLGTPFLLAALLLGGRAWRASRGRTP